MKARTFSDTPVRDEKRVRSGKNRRFGSALRAEALKTRRSLALWLTAGCALFIPLVWMLTLGLKSGTMLPRVSPAPWDYLFMQTYQSSTLLLPFFIVLIVNLIVHIEHRADAWKQLYVQPLPRGHIYFSKLLFIIFLVAASHLLFIGGVFLTGALSGSLIPEYHFLTAAPDLAAYSALLLRSFISVLGVVALQYALSYNIKNFSIPFGIGLAGVILSVMGTQAKEIIYIPYSYPMLSLFRYEKAGTALLADLHYYSLAYFLVFTAAGFILARKRVP